VTTDLSAAFRDPEIARRLADSIAAAATRPMKIMEVCGTHTVAIARNGLRDVMPENVKLLSGPGCPVCVTANSDIDLAIEIGRQPGVTLTSAT
jgi:hydrogenase expression/formation protein HypD